MIGYIAASNALLSGLDALIGAAEMNTQHPNHQFSPLATTT